MPPIDPDHYVAGAARPSALTSSRRTHTRALPPIPSRDLGKRLGRFAESLGGRTVIAALAVMTIVLATAVPAWALIATADHDPSRLQSSADATGSASTRVTDLGVTTFIGDLPFVAQQRYLTAIAGGEPEGKRFVEGARQAAVAAYVQDVGLQMTLPYLSGATNEKREIDAWTEAVATVEGRQGSPAYGFQAAWPPAGSSLTSTVTFYTCSGGGFCGPMAAGPVVFAGAAACSYDLPFGTRFYIADDPGQRVFTCLDRGLLTPTWVDLWFQTPDEGWAFQSIVGTHSSIVLVN